MGGLAKKLIASAGGEEKLYVDDVFSTYLYTGNSSTQTINNGIDLAGKGGLVWSKCRSNGGAGTNEIHTLIDTIRGAGYRLSSEDTWAQVYNSNTITAFNSTGFAIGNSPINNTSNYTYASWTFRKAPKFFDVVTYIGDGTSNRQIPHSLGVAPGMIIVKRTDSSENWRVDARMSDGFYRTGLALNLTNAGVASHVDHTSTYISLISIHSESGAVNSVNANGASYVAYLFAHDPSADGVIQCGSFTTDASGNATVNLGWEPQWLLWKSSSSVMNWQIADFMRGWANQGTTNATAGLQPNLSSAETANQYASYPTSTGFEIKGFTAGQSYIYLAIRRPNKPPKTGTEVFDLGFRLNSSTSGQPIFDAEFPVDLLMTYFRSGSASLNTTVLPRLTGSGGMVTALTDAESTKNYADGFDWNKGIDNDGLSYSATTDVISYMFRRAPGFFDVVAYTGDGGFPRDIPHSLGVPPDIILVKSRNSSTNGIWTFIVPYDPYSVCLRINTSAGRTLLENFTPVTSSTFRAPNYTGGLDAYGINTAGNTYVAYLFASLAGISKVGSYTGNGTSQAINCGFTTGARFVLVKRTDSTGDWYVWDTARGIVADNDPRLSLNTTAAEVTTDDSVDPESSGFIVNQNAATNINVNGSSYIYLAIA